MINMLDVIILAVAALCFGLGMITGVVWQIAGIISVIAGVVATFLFGDAAAHAMQRWVSHTGFATLVGHIGVFMLASLSVRILATVFSKMLEKAKLKTLDRFLGGAVGLVKAIAISAVLIVIMDRHGTPGTSQTVRESVLAAPVIWLTDLVAQKADEADVTEKGQQMLRRLKEAKESLGKPEPPSEPTSTDPTEEGAAP